jgi:hypothetical protein
MTTSDPHHRDARPPADSLQAVEADFPVPTDAPFPVEYRRVGGQVLLGQVTESRPIKEGEAPKRTFEPIASPLSVEACLDLADPYAGGRAGLRIRVRGLDGRTNTVDLPRALLAGSRASHALADLYAAGLRCSPGGEPKVISILRTTAPAQHVRVVECPGWLRSDGGEATAFICPSGQIARVQELPTRIELDRRSTLRATAASGGHLLGWREVASRVVVRHPRSHFALGFLAGAAGVVADLISEPSHGVALTGYTSSGKTTSLRCAVSWWSTPREGAGLLETMHTTDNAVEALAARANGTVLALDEIGHALGRNIGRTIHKLAGGKAKARLNRDLSEAARRGWRTFILVSGERSIEETARADGANLLPGEALRLSDIEVDDVTPLPDDEFEFLKTGLQAHYGHAGPAFVEGLIRAGYANRVDDLRARVTRAASRIAGPGAKPEAVRTARKFALLRVSGELAIEFDLLPGGAWLDDTIDWAWQSVGDRSSAGAFGEEARALESVREWIVRRLGGSIRDIGETRPYAGQLPDGWEDSGVVYLLATKLAEAAGGKLKQRRAARLLRDAGALAAVRDQRRLALSRLPNGFEVGVYAIAKSFLRAPKPNTPAAAQP